MLACRVFALPRSPAGGRRLMWVHIHDHYLRQADFFVKADDDTFLHMANLRDMLSTADPELPAYYGAGLCFVFACLLKLP